MKYSIVRALGIGTATFAMIVATSLPADAQNVGRCGWGSKLFDGQKGIAPQVLAVTTNGTSGNQTFAITSGTSGCTQDGVIRTNWKTAAFIDENMNRLALDASRGEGESLDALASLLGVAAGDKQAFDVALKANFTALFPREDMTTEEVLASLRGVLESDASLQQYSAQV